LIVGTLIAGTLVITPCGLRVGQGVQGP